MHAPLTVGVLQLIGAAVLAVLIPALWPLVLGLGFCGLDNVIEGRFAR